MSQEQVQPRDLRRLPDVQACAILGVDSTTWIDVLLTNMMCLGLYTTHPTLLQCISLTNVLGRKIQITPSRISLISSVSAHLGLSGFIYS